MNQPEVEHGLDEYDKVDPAEFEAGDDGDFLEEPDLDAGVA